MSIIKMNKLTKFLGYLCGCNSNSTTCSMNEYPFPSLCQGSVKIKNNKKNAFQLQPDILHLHSQLYSQKTVLNDMHRLTPLGNYSLLRAREISKYMKIFNKILNQFYSSKVCTSLLVKMTFQNITDIE